MLWSQVPSPRHLLWLVKLACKWMAERIEGKHHQAWHLSDTPISFHPLGIGLFASLSVTSTHMSLNGPATTYSFRIFDIDVEDGKNTVNPTGCHA